MSDKNLTRVMVEAQLQLLKEIRDLLSDVERDANMGHGLTKRVVEMKVKLDKIVED